MARDTGSPPQCEPQDLSIKSRGHSSTDTMHAYQHAKEEPSPNETRTNLTISYRIMGPMMQSCQSPRNRIIAVTRTPDSIKQCSKAYRKNVPIRKKTVTAVTKSPTPLSKNPAMLHGIVHTPTNDGFVYRQAPIMLNGTTAEGTTAPAHSAASCSQAGSDLKSCEDKGDLPPAYPFVALYEDNGNKETTQMCIPASERPNSLNLSNAEEQRDTSPDSGLESVTPVFCVIPPRTPAETTVSPETCDDQSKGTYRRRKRKLGPGRGWKFHDLSNDGGANKKRAYAHNRLENEILQRFQDRVCVKTVQTLDSNKDKLVIIEPSEVTDSDLIRCGTSLRLVFDKEVGTYKLQLLPFTLEGGPLSDQKRVMAAVSKMLAENKEVLCPSVFTLLLQTGNSVVIGERADDGSCILLNSPTETQYVTSAYGGDDCVMRGRRQLKKKTLLPPGQERQSHAKQRDMLLWSLNNELARNNNALAGASAAGRKKCLMWHVPSPDYVPTRLHERLPTVSKWCINCKAPSSLQSPQTLNSTG